MNLQEKASHDKYIWIGRDDEEIERVLKSTLESNVETEDPLWNICSEVLRALMAARKVSFEIFFVYILVGSVKCPWNY